MNYIVAIDFLKSDEGLVRLDNTLKDYWRQNPPYLSHAYLHGIMTGHTSVDIGSTNSDARNYPPQNLFAVGFLHDVYRPVEGSDGQEEHSKRAAELAREICSSAGFPLNEEEIAAIEYADKVLSVPAKVLFVADKADFTTERCFAYCSETNNKFVAKGKEPRYTSMKKVLSDFKIKTMPNWRILLDLLYDFKEAELALDTYRKTEEDMHRFFFEEIEGRDEFNSIVERYVSRYREDTIHALMHSGLSRQEAEKMFLM